MVVKIDFHFQFYKINSLRYDYQSYFETDFKGNFKNVFSIAMQSKYLCKTPKITHVKLIRIIAYWK